MVDRIEVAGRLVGEDEVRIVDQAAGDGHALLLTAGELRGPMLQPLAQADHLAPARRLRCRSRWAARPW